MRNLQFSFELSPKDVWAGWPGTLSNHLQFSFELSVVHPYIVVGEALHTLQFSFELSSMVSDIRILLFDGVPYNSLLS